jgi:endonuclease G
MKQANVFLIIMLLMVFCVLSSCKWDFEGPNAITNSNVIYTFTKEDVADSYVSFDFLPAFSLNEIVKNKYYTLSYNEEGEQTECIAYELKKKYVTSNNFKRLYFIVHPKVKSAAADWRNYKNSGYDKGRLTLPETCSLIYRGTMTLSTLLIFRLKIMSLMRGCGIG